MRAGLIILNGEVVGHVFCPQGGGLALRGEQVLEVPETHDAIYNPAAWHVLDVDGVKALERKDRGE